MGAKAAAMQLTAAAETTVPAAASPVPIWTGSHAYDADGARIGRIVDVLFDAQTRAAAWVLLETTSPDERCVFAPARGLRHRADGVHLACDHERVLTAPPSAAPPDGLTRGHALALAAHFGVRCGGGPWHGAVEPALRGAGARMETAG